MNGWSSKTNFQKVRTCAFSCLFIFLLFSIDKSVMVFDFLQIILMCGLFSLGFETESFLCRFFSLQSGS